MRGISIVIPTLNEAGNIPGLVRRIAHAFDGTGIEYEVVFIDDHSTDGTMDEIARLSVEHPNIVCFAKEGKRGKAQSLIQGFAWAQFDRIGFIDADLQYPPEAIPKMFDLLDHGYDIVVADRVQHDEGLLRTITSKGFNFFFSRFLHGLSCDVQSGLKVFKRRIAREVNIEHPSPWTFDLEFLLTARNYGYVIGSVPIRLEPRRSGESKIRFLRAVYEIGWNALCLRFTERPPLLITPDNAEGSMVGAGVAHGSERFVTHTTLHHDLSALRTFAPWQKTLGLSVLLVVLAGLFLNPLLTGISVLAILTAVYFFDSVFQLFLVLRSLKTPPEIGSTPQELLALDGERLPTYSILCPLYREANMLPTFVDAMNRLDWPKDRLDIMLLLEENDRETIDAARAMNLPDTFRILVVPHSLPKTKPKACNYGLNYAKGEYVVIYDAEDIPDPEQLKKAYLGFRKAGSSVRCLQAKLNYFNPHQNLLTRFFTAEYSLWFDVVLPGLQSINTSIPLGGTSNHFRTRDLLELEGWDPFNVTEDCDLGVRIFKRGFKTAIIDSVTLEEANSHVGNWIRQRSRWIKGYMQTYLVHMRDPIAFFRENGLHAFVFQLVVGMKIGFMFINPILWVATVSYFTLYAVVGPTIQSLFPPAVFYLASFSLVFGNFLYLYYYMIGAAKREHYSVVKYVFLIPLYWAMLSYAAFVALYQLIVKPHYWEKTVHGLHKGSPKQKRARIRLARTGARAKRDEPKKETKVVAVLRRIVPGPVTDFVFSSQGFYLFALVISNFINFVFNAIVGRELTFEQLSLVTLMNTLWSLATVVISSYSSTMNHRVAYLDASDGRKEAISFFMAALRQGLIVAIGASVLWIFASPYLTGFFHIDRVLVLLLFTPAFAFGVVASGCRGFLQGTYYFKLLSALYVAESGLKLLMAVAFIRLGFPEWAYLSIPLSIVVIAGLSYLSGFLVLRKHERPERAVHRFPAKFFSSALLFSLSSVTFLSVDIILVNHYMDPLLAGQYALLALTGKMIFFIGSLPNALTITFISRNEGLKRDTDKILYLIYGMVLFTVVCGVLILGVFGRFVTPILFGDKVRVIFPLLFPYTVAIAFFTLTSVLVSFHLAKRHYAFSTVSFLLSFCAVVGIVFFHGSPADIVRVILAVCVIGWGIIQLLDFYYRELRFVRRGFTDLLDIFFRRYPVPVVPPGKKKILIFNWRDTKHSFAGGAEVYAHEIAKEWVRAGHHVTLFSGNDGRQKRHEILEGIEIVRRGGFYLVYLWAFLYYALIFRNRYDVVVDCENGIPFFTPLYVRKPQVLCLMHHVHQEVFRHSLPGPLSVLAQFLEKDLMPIVYRDVKFITVSESSRSEMQAIGLGHGGIVVMNPGIDITAFTGVLTEKSEQPTILYLGRLKGYKSVNVLIQAFRIVLDKRPDARLVIAGSGEEGKNLRRLAVTLGLTSDQIRFAGQVDDAEKVRLLQSSWMLVNPSFMEGWGIVAIEANACGTPVIASDVPGLRDSVCDESTGYLFEYGDVKELSEKILHIIEDRNLREGMSAEARIWARNFDWKRTSEGILALIKER